MHLLKALTVIFFLEGAQSDYIHPASGARGMYQLKPIAVQEANRILRRDVFAYADASNKYKAQAMAVLILSHHRGWFASTEEYLRVWNAGSVGARQGRGEAYVRKAKRLKLL